MKRLLFFLLFLSTLSYAQYFEGYATSNYAGVNGILYNPASMVDSRVRLDINFTSFSLTGINNFIGFDTRWWNPRDTTLFEIADYAGDGGLKNGILTGALLGPSFMYTFNENHSIAFTTRFKSLYNFNNFSNDIAGVYFGQSNAPSGSERDFSINHATWIEYGLAYGSKIYQYKHHWVSWGGQLKLLKGVHYARMAAESLSWSVDTDGTVNLRADEYNYQLAANNSARIQNAIFSGRNFGVGLDFGINYEWRPKSESYVRDINGKKVSAHEMSKHEIRIGWAVNDIGLINYELAAEGKNQNINVDIDPNNIDVSNWSAVTELHEAALDSQWLPSSYTFWLPATTSFQADFHLFKGFYANIHTFHSLSNAYRLRYINRVTLVPRWDWKWIGIYLPQTLDETGQLRSGINAMLGPFLLGTNDLSTFLNDGPKRYANFNFGVKVTSHHYRPNDLDGDGVTDEVDECIKIKGPWQFKGCPDTDGDSIPDKSDLCPEIHGKLSLRGCPDTDDDGITDLKDSCPTVFGVAEFNGCPDTDLDGVPDTEDYCPNKLGLKKFNGCPDFDEDGLPDKSDACPLVAGDIIQDGCPDTDQDGIYDHKDSCLYVYGIPSNNGCPAEDSDVDGIPDLEDKCPQVFGSIENNGCPNLDFDDDGIANELDSCPKTAGLKENSGCPVLDQYSKTILQEAFDNLEFETNSDEIKEESFASLDSLAKFLIKHKDWKLLLAGHTDNIGDAQDNLVLSKNRCLSVRQYLFEQGVEPKRINYAYFGESVPIADNSTKDGRQRNRRVEIGFVFD